jgi:hypothetical protein
VSLATVPLDLPFLDVLAARWLAAHADPAEPLAAARGLILLPTRRAARALSEAFLRASGGRAMLQPRIAALGALDEAPLALGGWLDLPPAIDPLQRLSLLSLMVLQAGDRFGTAPTLDQAWPLAQALASLLDEAARAGCDLAATLPDAAADQAEHHAEHWQLTLAFLGIVTERWPALLDETGQTDPVARAMALLEAQSASWRERPPDFPVWAAVNPAFGGRRAGPRHAGAAGPGSAARRGGLAPAAGQPSAGRTGAAAGVPRRAARRFRPLGPGRRPRRALRPARPGPHPGAGAAAGAGAGRLARPVRSP